MMKKIIFNGIKNHKYDLIMYPAEFFELRIQEEIVRTDEYKVLLFMSKWTLKK